jgi:ferredoxin
MSEVKIQVNPIGCKAHGLCAEILPEWVELDEWGYPVLAAEPLPADLIAYARRAARSCPTLAIVLQEN